MRTRHRRRRGQRAARDHVRDVGPDVDAVDPDDSMLAQAEANIAERGRAIAAAGGELRLVRGGFGELAALGLGRPTRSCARATRCRTSPARDGLQRGARDFAAVLRPGRRARAAPAQPRAAARAARRARSRRSCARRPRARRSSCACIDYPAGDEFLDFDFVTLDARRRRASGTIAHRALAAHGAARRRCSATSSTAAGLRRASSCSAATTATRSTPTTDESVIVRGAAAR